MNFLIIESLQKFHHYYGDDFRIECPTGSGKLMSLDEAANELACRLTRIFLTDERGVRPLYANHARLQSDPHFRDYLLFYEYFHGDSGRGIGASHQTGWTGLVAKLLLPRYARAVLEPLEAQAESRAVTPPVAAPSPTNPRPRAPRSGTPR